MTPRRTPSEEQVRDAFGEVGDALQRALVLSSDRVQSVLEDAVLRGRMTRRDAEDLAGHLVSVGREQAQELRTALARSVGDTVATAGEAVAHVGDTVATAVPLAKKKSRRGRTGGRPTNGTGSHHVNGTNGHGSNGSGSHENGNGTRHVNGTTHPTGHVAKVAVTSNLPDDPAGLTARELVDLTATLGNSELWTLRELEAAGKARATVLKAIDRKLNR